MDRKTRPAILRKAEEIMIGNVRAETRTVLKGRPKTTPNRRPYFLVDFITGSAGDQISVRTGPANSIADR